MSRSARTANAEHDRRSQPDPGRGPRARGAHRGRPLRPRSSTSSGWRTATPSASRPRSRSRRRPPEPRRSSTALAEVEEATLNGRPSWRRAPRTGASSFPTSSSTTSWWSTPCSAVPMRVRASTVRWTRATARCTSGRASSRTTPAWCSPASTSPTSRRCSASRSTRPNGGRSRATWGASADDHRAGRRARGPSRTRRRCRRTSRWSTPGRSSSCAARRDGYDLGLYARRSLAPMLERDAEELFDLTAKGLAFYGEQFAMPFPQPRYDQVFVPEYGGAMENYGCVTWSDGFIYRDPPSYADREERALVLLHEMAHMWFGDMVTMRWWDDLWLNEAFAEWACGWAAVNCTEFTDMWAAMLATDKQNAYAADAAPTTHPIRQRARRRRDRGGQLRRHHLPQGRGGPQAARRLRRGGHLRQRAEELLPQARLGQHHPRRPDRGARVGQWPRPLRLGRGLAGDLRHRPPHARTPGRRTHPGGDAAGRSGTAAAPPADRRRTPRGVRDSPWSRRSPWRLPATHPGRRRHQRGPAAGQRRGPDLRHRAHGPGLAGDPALPRW